MTRMAGLVPLLLLLGCAGEQEVSIKVRDARGPVRGIAILEVGTGNSLGVTAVDGEAVIAVPPLKGGVYKIELKERGDDALYRFDNPYVIDAAVQKAGILTIQAAEADAEVAGVATLLLDTTPPGAEVTLDDEPKGRTPLVLDALKPGYHNLRLTREGFHPREATIGLEAGENPLSYELRPASVLTANLEVTSDPEGAAISIDGKATGQRTNATLADLRAGSHTVRLVKSGFKSYEGSVNLEAGGSGRFSSILTEQAEPSVGQPPEQTKGGTVRYKMACKGGYARVYLKGQLLNPDDTKMNFTVDLPTGAQVFEVKSAEKVFSVRYTVKTGDTHKGLVLNLATETIEPR